MLQPTVNLSSQLECPKCGKHAIVSHQTGIYQCLGCDFKRNFSSEPLPEKTEGGLGEFVFACVGFLIALALLL